jgi:ABC-type multidrug transport system fused ATPase/permease subunit
MNTITLDTEDIRNLYADINSKADRIIGPLLILMFFFGVFIAFFYDTWLVAIGVGTLCLLAYFITRKLLPGSDLYQYVLSAVCAIFAAQYIYQMHGMAEMHFWVFISSTALIIYQNWRLQIPLILIVYVHHGAFAYLQYTGYKDVYFTQLEYMDLTTFLFHAVLAAGVCLVSGIWGYNIHRRTVQDALNFKTLSALQKEVEQNARKVEELNKDLMLVNKDVKEKNEELRASEEELLASAEELKQINENLNGLVENRTQALINQNKKLVQHAFINSHKVRSPLARILGLVNLIGYEIKLSGTGKDLLEHLNISANELDDILKEVRINLEEAEFREE